MKKILLFTALAASCNLALAQTPGFAWAKQTIGTNSATVSDGAGIAVDTVNNFVYVTGRFSGSTINFGSGDQPGGTGNTNVYLAKFTLSGSCVWAKTFAAGWDNYGTGVGVDHNGNVYLTGYSESDTVTFGTGYIYNSNHGSTDHTVGFVTKFDANGNNIWLKGSTGGGGVICNAIAVDANGNSYTTGHVFNSASTMVGNTTNEGFFALKLDTNGNSVWFDQTTGAGAPLQSEGVAIAIDRAGNIVAAGAHVEAITFGTYSIPYASGNGTTDRFAVKMDGTTGAYIWAIAAGVWEGPDFNHCVTVDGANNIFLSGTLSIDDEGPGSSAYTAGPFVEKLNSSGVSQWIISVPGNFANGYPMITADNSGNCYLALSISDTATFGAYTIEPNLMYGANTSEVNVIAKLNPSGIYQYVKASVIPSGGFALTTPQAVARDQDNNIYFQGYLEGQNNFDMTNLDGGSDLKFYIAKLGSTVSGINEIGQLNTMYGVYPNPANDLIYIDKLTGKTTMQIVDISGKEVIAAQLTNSTESIDVSSLQNGIYFIELTTTTSHVTQKLIIAK